MIVTLLHMVTNVAIGFLAYIFRDKLTGHMAEEWQDICDFSLGFFYLTFPILAMFNLLSDKKNHPDIFIQSGIFRLFVSILCSGIPFISGAIVGFRFFPSDRYKKND